MRVLACADKFRGTATASEIGDAVKAAVVAAGGSCVVQPMADGGEGTLDAFGGPNRTTTVTGPLGEPVDAEWRLSDGVAVIEMARALATLGLAVAELPDEVPEFELSQRQIELLSRDIDGTHPWVNEISLAHCVRAAARWSVPLTEAAPRERRQSS